VRTLLGTGMVGRRLDSAGLVNFLTFGSAYDPLTLIEGIRTLPAGHALTWEAGTVHERAYWDLVDDAGVSEVPGANDGLPAGQLREMLEETVRMQLVSDVPVGVFLSGGIDSSALVSILSRDGIKPRQ